MNQAIKIIDEMIKETRACQTGKDFVKKEIQKAMISALQIARDKLSYLYSDTQWIDVLQRYNEAKVCDIKKIVKSDNGEYIRYDDLVNLLNVGGKK